MSYTDIFVVPVPKTNIEKYRHQAETFLRVWRDHGALSCMEVEGDDVPVGKVSSFPQSVALKPDETVLVGIMTYHSRAHRDDVSAKAMKDPRMAGMKPETMPFDGKRMFFGGFKPFVDAPANATVGVQPYLFFRGRCEEAIDYYKSKLGAEVLMMMRFKESPEPPPPNLDMSAHQDKIMHATLRINGADIMMSDGMRSGPLDFQCMSLSLSVASEADVDRVFNALAAEGTVQMPLSKKFFAARFGSVTDKFGVAWMVMAPSNGTTNDQPS